VVEQDADAVPEAVAGSFGCLAQQRLELGEGHLDRVHVGRVRREQEELGTGGGDRGTNRQQHVTCGSAKLVRLARGGFIFAGRDWPAPNRFPTYANDTEAEGIPDELLSLDRETQGDGFLDSHPYKRK